MKPTIIDSIPVLQRVNSGLAKRSVAALADPHVSMFELGFHLKGSCSRVKDSGDNISDLDLISSLNIFYPTLERKRRSLHVFVPFAPFHRAVGRLSELPMNPIEPPSVEVLHTYTAEHDARRHLSRRAEEVMQAARELVPFRGYNRP